MTDFPKNMLSILVQFMHEISLADLNRHTGEVFPSILSYDKPCGKLALGQNCIKTISVKSNSVAMVLRIEDMLLNLSLYSVRSC